MYVHWEMLSAGVSQRKKLELSGGEFLLKLDAVTPRSLVHVANMLESQKEELGGDSSVVHRAVFPGDSSNNILF